MYLMPDCSREQPPKEKYFSKRTEIFGMSGEGPYLCIPNRNKPLVDNRKGATQKVERSLKVWKQQHVDQVFTVRFMLAKNID